MESWKNLKIYKNLPPEEIPKKFKELSNQILKDLKDEGFNLKESRTIKKLYRFNDELEQAIYLSNTNSYAKNQKEISISITIKHLNINEISPNIHFRVNEIDSKLKMSYPLTKEYSLLGLHLLENFKEILIPFFDNYDTNEKIVSQRNSLLSITPLVNCWGLERFIFDCAFKIRNEEVFDFYFSKFLNEKKLEYEKIKNHKENSKLISNDIDALNQLKTVFYDNVLFKKAIEDQNREAKEYILLFPKMKNL